MAQLPPKLSQVTADPRFKQDPEKYRDKWLLEMHRAGRAGMIPDYTPEALLAKAREADLFGAPTAAGELVSTLVEGREILPQEAPRVDITTPEELTATALETDTPPDLPVAVRLQRNIYEANKQRARLLDDPGTSIEDLRRLNALQAELFAPAEREVRGMGKIPRALTSTATVMAEAYKDAVPYTAGGLAIDALSRGATGGAGARYGQKLGIINAFYLDGKGEIARELVDAGVSLERIKKVAGPFGLAYAMAEMAFDIFPPLRGGGKADVAKRSLVDFAKKYVVNTAVETSEEALQSFAKEVATTVAKQAEGTPYAELVQDFDWRGWSARTWEEMKTAAPVAAIMTGPATVVESLPGAETPEPEVAPDVVQEPSPSVLPVEEQVAAAPEVEAEVRPAEGAPEAVVAEEAVTPVEAPAPLVIETEPGPERPRRFLARAQEAPGTPQEVLDALDQVQPQTYEQHRSSQEFEGIRQWLTEDPGNVAVAEQRVRSDEPVSATKALLGVALLDSYRQAGNVAAEQALTDSLDKQFREAGRYVQAASFWNKLSGGAWRKALDGYFKKYGVEIPVEARAELDTAFDEASKLPDGPEKQAALNEAITRAATFAPLRPSDWLDAYRYTNMLSSPLTTARNMTYNLFQAFVTRPAALLGNADIRGAGVYLNRSLRSWADATDQYRQAMASIGRESKFIERSNLSALEAARLEQLPGALTWVGRFMDAQDRFMSTLIASGETARLIGEGAEPRQADARAQALAQQYLLREELGTARRNENEAAAVRAIDGLGEMFQKGRSIPYLGRAWGWFVPFTRTPVNWAKAGVRASPAGFLGGKMDAERRGLANAGSVVMATGAALAAAGMTTWKPPKDKKEKEAFYASGRRPYSVYVNGKWVPMWYFGPFAFALAVPAAARDAWKDNPQLAGAGWGDKLADVASGLARFFSSQTPLHGVSGFLRLVGGEEDFTPGRMLGFTAGQFVPLGGLVRYVNTIVDPKYRRSRGFADTLKKDLPILSQELEPYTDPDGTPAERPTSSYLLPFPVGTPDMQYEKLLQERRQTISDRRRNEKELDEMVELYKEGQTAIEDVWAFIYQQPGEEVARLRQRVRRKHKDVPLPTVRRRRTRRRRTRR